MHLIGKKYYPYIITVVRRISIVKGSYILRNEQHENVYIFMNTIVHPYLKFMGILCGHTSYEKWRDVD